MLHPKQFAPQPGIYTGIQDMDWFIVRQAATKESIRRRYGVNGKRGRAGPRCGAPAMSTRRTTL